MNKVLHRGDTSIAQENSLDAIINNSYNLIEIDILCDTDDFFIMHDTNLSRLVGIDKHIKEMKDIDIFSLKSYKYNDNILKYDKQRPITTFRKVINKLKEISSLKKLCLDLKIDDFDKNNTNDINRINKLCKCITMYQDHIMYVSAFNFDMLEYIKTKLVGIDFGLFMSNKNYDAVKYIDKIKPKYKIYHKDDIHKINKDGEYVNMIYTVHISDANNIKYDGIDHIIIDTFYTLEDLKWDKIV